MREYKNMDEITLRNKKYTNIFNGDNIRRRWFKWEN